MFHVHKISRMNNDLASMNTGAYCKGDKHLKIGFANKEDVEEKRGDSSDCDSNTIVPALLPN